MLRKAISAAILAGFLVTGAAAGDKLVIEGIQADSGTNRPGRGLSQTSVEKGWGTPRSKRAPVGDPPISRWDYGGFVVYFEYDKVIHSVAKR
jgi:hypothetical protein